MEEYPGVWHQRKKKCENSLNHDSRKKRAEILKKSAGHRDTLNFDTLNHTMKSYPFLMNAGKAAQRKMYYLKTTVTGRERIHLVLLDLCRQLDGLSLSPSNRELLLYMQLSG